MALTLTHPFVSAKPDGADATKVQPSNWNAAHSLSGAAIGDLLVASSASVLGAIAAVAVGQVLVSGGVGAVPAWSASPSLMSPTMVTPILGVATATSVTTGAIDSILVNSIIGGRKYDAFATVSTTITAALAAITDATYFKRYLLYVPNGTYTEEITPKSFVDIMGQSRAGVIITSSNAGGGLSTIRNMGGCDCMISNLTAIHTGITNNYAIHVDAYVSPPLGPVSHTIFYNVTAQNTGPAFGIGTFLYQYIYIINSSASSTTDSGIWAHNNSIAQAAPSKLYLINDIVSGSDYGLRWGNSGSGQPDLVQIAGGAYTGATGGILSYNNPDNPGSGEGIIAIDAYATGTVTMTTGTRIYGLLSVSNPALQDRNRAEYSGVAYLGGNTSAFPAFVRNSTTIGAKLASDLTTDVALTASNIRLSRSGGASTYPDVFGASGGLVLGDTISGATAQLILASGGPRFTGAAVTISSATTPVLVFDDGAGRLVKLLGASSTQNPSLGTWYNAAFSLFTNSLERVSIDNTGRVGIGTTGPDSLLALAATGVAGWLGRSGMSSPANGQWNLTNNAISAGVGVDVATDAILKIRTRAQSAYATVDALGYKVSGTAGANFGPSAVVSITIVNGLVTAAS